VLSKNTISSPIVQQEFKASSIPSDPDDPLQQAEPPEVQTSPSLMQQLVKALEQLSSAA
jgi:hypothetical protein